MVQLIYNNRKDKRQLEIASVKGFEMTGVGVYVGNYVGNNKAFQN